MNPKLIYLDNNASTQCAPEVVACMGEVLAEHWGNPSSLHAFGERALRRVERARSQVASLIGARFDDELIFTSGGTESINTAIHMALAGARPAGMLITSSTEHSAVLEPLARLEQGGREVLRMDVDAEGHLKLDELLSAIDQRAQGCALVSLQWANNETGALLADAEIGAIAEGCHRHGTLFHLDAVQVPGKLPMDVQALGADLVSISAHKFHGPQGVGALYLRRKALERVRPLIAGGPQEAERRGGTQNVAGIAGMGLAACMAQAHVDCATERDRVRGLRNTLEQGLTASLAGTRVHGAAPQSLRLDNTSSLFLPAVDGHLLLGSLAAEGLALSSGAACSSSKKGPSEVLLAMGLEPEVAAGSLRFSLSRYTTPEEIQLALELVTSVVEELTEFAPLQPLDPRGSNPG